MSGHRKLTCGEAVALLYDYLDREGAQASIENVEEHLQICRHCCDRFAFEASLWKVVRRKGTEAHCPESLKLRVSKLLDDY